jgi:periplasmic divalent cation tolerance protein
MAASSSLPYLLFANRHSLAHRRTEMRDQDTQMALVYCPCPSLEEAKRLGNALLDARVAGCINILPGMVSLYDWKGAREEAAEVVLIAKTTSELADGVKKLLEREHSYDIPAILTLPLTDMNSGYRDWLLQNIRRGA